MGFKSIFKNDYRWRLSDVDWEVIPDRGSRIMEGPTFSRPKELGGFMNGKTGGVGC